MSATSPLSLPPLMVMLETSHSNYYPANCRLSFAPIQAMHTKEEQWFYVEELPAVDVTVNLSEQEAAHAVRVLRKHPGDFIALTDGDGHVAVGVMVSVAKGGATVCIESITTIPAYPYAADIAIAPTKNIRRMVWCVEKLTELGARRIIPLICERSVRTGLSVRKLRSVAIGAMKQAQRAWLPDITGPVTLREYIDRLPHETKAIKYIATHSPDSVQAQAHYQPGNDVIILIGPEGDFTPAEIDFARSAHFVPLSLGDYRLRTETAAIAAVVTIQTCNQRK